MAKRTGTCPICKLVFPLSKSGTLRKHQTTAPYNHFGRVNGKQPDCWGVGRFCLEQGFGRDGTERPRRF